MTRDERAEIKRRVKEGWHARPTRAFGQEWCVLFPADHQAGDDFDSVIIIPNVYAAGDPSNPKTDPSRSESADLIDICSDVWHEIAGRVEEPNQKKKKES